MSSSVIVVIGEIGVASVSIRFIDPRPLVGMFMVMLLPRSGDATGGRWWPAANIHYYLAIFVPQPSPDALGLDGLLFAAVARERGKMKICGMATKVRALPKRFDGKIQTEHFEISVSGCSIGIGTYASLR